MGFLDKLLKGKSDQASHTVTTTPNTVYLPIAGKVISLKEINDGVFSEGILGPGCGIEPSDNQVYAPVNGKIVMIAKTKHALGIMSEDGIELLIHVGMDTVDMNGDGFEVKVKDDQVIHCGDLLMRFDPEKIKQADHSTTSALIVSNSSEFAAVDVLQNGDAPKLTPCLKVTPK